MELSGILIHRIAWDVQFGALINSTKASNWKSVEIILTSIHVSSVEWISYKAVISSTKGVLAHEGQQYYIKDFLFLTVKTKNSVYIMK